MFVVVYALDNVDLPRLQYEVRRVIPDPWNRDSRLAIVHSPVSKTLATRLVWERQFS